MNEARYREAERAVWASMGADPTERMVRLGRAGTTVRVQELGDGPPVLFVHGASNAGTSWAALAARLPGFRCILLDRPGCGLSEPLARPLGDLERLGAFADDLAVDVLDSLDLERAALIGTSFGGYFVLRAAAAHPGRVTRLVELSWALGAPAVSAPLHMRLATHPALGKLTLRIPPSEAMVKSILKQIGLRGALESGRFGPVEIAWFQSVLRDTRTMRNELDAVPRIMTMRGFDEATLLPAALLARITSPALLLWGADDPMGGASIAHAFAALLPRAELEVLANAGHAPWIDDPDGVASRVAEFLAR